MVIERYNHVLPDWSPRIAWSSSEAQSAWEDKFYKIIEMLEQLEIDSVCLGVRNSALIFVQPDQLVRLSNSVQTYGKMFYVLDTTPRGSKKLHHKDDTISEIDYIAVITKPENIPIWLAAYQSKDYQKMGQLLEYPQCCIDAYVQREKDKFVDFMWPVSDSKGTEGPPECNPMSRYIGIHMTPHIPCSFSCEHTKLSAQRFEKLAIELGREREWSDLRNILSWNFEWSALHGVGIVRNPVYKLSIRTDATPKKYIVKKEGNIYPEVGASGIEFPYKNKQKVVLTTTRSFKAGLLNEEDYKLAGYSSPDDMMKSYYDVIKQIKNPGSIIHFDCKNGYFLKECAEKFPTATLIGVEPQIALARKSQLLVPKAYITTQYDDTLPITDNAYAVITMGTGILPSQLAGKVKLIGLYVGTLTNTDTNDIFESISEGIYDY